MVNGNAIEPGAAGGFPTELVHFTEGFEKDVVCGVLGFLGIAQQPQSQVIDRAAVLFIEIGKI